MATLNFTWLLPMAPYDIITISSVLTRRMNTQRHKELYDVNCTLNKTQVDC